jgi:hypothetical protein
MSKSTLPQKRKAKKRKAVFKNEAVSSYISQLFLEKNETYTKSELEILVEEEQKRQEEFEKLEDYLCAINPGRERLKYREVFFEIKK